MTTSRTLIKANACASAALTTLSQQGFELDLGETRSKLFDDISALIAAVIEPEPAAAPDIRRLGFVIGNDEEYRRLLIADFDLTDIRAKAAAAQAAGVPEIALPLPEGWSARLIGAYTDADGAPAAPSDVFLGDEDRQTVFNPDPNERYRWEDLPGDAQEVVDQDGDLDAYLRSQEATFDGVQDYEASGVAGARLYVNTSTLGVSAEITTWADSGDTDLTSTGFLLADLVDLSDTGPYATPDDAEIVAALGSASYSVQRLRAERAADDLGGEPNTYLNQEG